VETYRQCTGMPYEKQHHKKLPETGKGLHDRGGKGAGENAQSRWGSGSLNRSCNGRESNENHSSKKGPKGEKSENHQKTRGQE